MADRALLAVIESALAVAWADGNYDEREFALIEDMVQNLPPATGSAGGAPRLKDIRQVLTTDEAREYCYQRAAMISVVDGIMTDSERRVLDRLRDALGLSAEAATELETSARALVTE